MSENDDLTTLLILEEAENAPPVQRGGCLTLIIGIIGLSTAYLVITVVFLCLSLTPFVFAVISVYLASILTFSPPAITLQMLWFIAPLLALASLRVLAFVLRFRMKGIRVYGTFYLAVTLIAVAGSFTGLLFFLDSWAAALSASLSDLMAELAQGTRAVKFQSVGFDAQSMFEGLSHWFGNLDRRLMEVFIVTYCSMLLSEVCLVIGWMYRKNQERKATEQVQTIRA